MSVYKLLKSKFNIPIYIFCKTRFYHLVVFVYGSLIKVVSHDSDQTEYNRGSYSCLWFAELLEKN